MGQPRILTFNFHEPYLCMMARTGLAIDVGLYKSGPLARPWHTFYRPVPENFTLVPEPEWRGRLESGHYQVVVAHNEMNALSVARAPAAKLLVCHNRRTFLSTSVTIAAGDPVQQFNELIERLQNFFEFVFISPSKQQDYAVPGRVILPGIDVEEWGGYTGEEAAVLRVGNMMRERNLMFDVGFQEGVLEGLPNRVLGLNPDIPGSVPAESFEALCDAYRKHRCLLHVTREAYEDGYNLSMLEAMACGMPVVSLANAYSPITDGEDGYLAYAPELLHERLRTLLEDPELARDIGAKGRQLVAERFPLSRFVEQWRAALFNAADRGPQTPPPLPKAQSRKILLEYVSSPFTTARYFERAARAHHEVVTAGFRLPEKVLEMWGFEQPPPAYPPQQIDLPFDANYALMHTLLPAGFTPDFLLWIDSGQDQIPEDIKSLPCPKVAYIIDSHIATARRIEMARHFDQVFLAQRGQVDQFLAAGISKVRWLPLACDPGLHALPPRERGLDVAYVGSLSATEGERRLHLLRRIGDAFPNHFIGRAWPEEMARIYAEAKIVVNACHNQDLNMRVFEAMAAGALLITDSAVGLEDWFEPGKHLVVYRDDEEVFGLIKHYLAHDEPRDRIAREGQALVLRNHTYARRFATLVSLLEPLLENGAGAAAEAPKFREYYQNVRREVLEHVPRLARRVLDVGCGAGALGNALKQERGVQEVVGVEIIESAYRDARKVLDKVFLGSIEELDLPFPDGHFDCVICADVLEHLVDPEAVLRKLARLIAPEGVLIISIPNIRYHGIIGMLSLGGWSYMDAGIMDSTHLRFFTSRTLPEFVQAGGLEVLSLAPLNRVPPYQTPRDPEGAMQMGKVKLHEVSDEEHTELLTIQFAVIAGHPGVDRFGTARDALKRGDFEAAVAHAVDAVGVDEAERLQLIGIGFARLGDLAKAEEFLCSAVDRRRDPAILGELGLVHVAQSKPMQALPLLEEASHALPDEERFRGGRGLALLALDRPAEAFEDLRAVLTGSVEHAQLLPHFVAAGSTLGQLDDVVPVLRKYVEYYPGNLESLCDCAEVLIQTGQREEAAERLDTVLLFEPAHARAQALRQALEAP